MNEYKDLTYYSERHFENALNVGWVALDKQHGEEYDKHLLLEKLIPYLDYPFNTVRGASNAIKWSYNNQTYVLGFSELRILSQNGIVYAAPNTILYCIDALNYLPPQEFIDAVMNGFSFDTFEYATYMKHYTRESFWGEDQIRREKRLMIEGFIEAGKATELKALLSSDPESLNLVTQRGSILNLAILLGQHSIIDMLLEMGLPFENYNGMELITAITKRDEIVSKKLLDTHIPLDNSSLKVNPLFVAIAYKQNLVAKTLFVNSPNLRCSYTTEFEKECDVLKWAASCDNIEMFAYIRKHLEQ